MKILVTGGAGYIGSHTTFQLIDQGHEVVVLDNLYSGNKWALHPKAKFVLGSIGDDALLQKLFSNEKFDAVMHFAAYIEVEESTRLPDKYFLNNATHAALVFESAKNAGVPNIIFSSTAAVYGLPKVEMIDEFQPIAPINPYGSSKAMAEKMLVDICGTSDGGTKFVILRYFNVAGARLDLKIGEAPPHSTHLIKIASEVASGVRPQMKIYGEDYKTPDGTCVRDYIHVEDLAAAHLSALRYLQAGGSSDVFNVGYGRGFSVKQVIEEMRKVSKHPVTAEKAERRPGDPDSLVADSSRLMAKTDWKPKYDNLTVICETALGWEKRLIEIKKSEARV